MQMTYQIFNNADYIDEWRLNDNYYSEEDSQAFITYIEEDTVDLEILGESSNYLRN